MKIYDMHHDDSLLFYTMEYVEGKSLRHWMKQRRQLDFGSVVRVLSLVAHALEHAHKITIHRDLSPENIMVLQDGSIRLLDFGLAKLADANKSLTMIGSSLGKFQYVAPEQRLNAAHVDHRADLYPLGIMFFEMLAGHLPDGREKISEIRPDLPPQADSFVTKAIAGAPEQRFQSAREFRQALMALYELQKKHVTPPPAPVRSRMVSPPPVLVATPAGFLARLRARWGRFFRRSPQP